MKTTHAIVTLILISSVSAITGCGKKESPAPGPIVVSKDKPIITPPRVEPPTVDDTGMVKIEFDVAVDPKSIIVLGGSEYSIKTWSRQSP
ncbi:MAG: hypothetical protein L0Y71_13235 [Gemmataceae bacterium]|nr:hypothetical protein [Gemmataceae bacterium]